MKFLDLIYICKSSIIRTKKSNYWCFVFCSVISLMILIAFTLEKTISNYINDNIEKNIEYRTIFIQYDVLSETLTSVISKVSDLEHIDAVLKKEEYDTYVYVNQFKTSKTNGEINLIATNFIMNPPIIYGRNIEKDEKNVLICPINFIADSNLLLRRDLNKEDYIDVRNYLNKEIEISYYAYDYSYEIPRKVGKSTSKYKLIGIYDTNDNYLNSNVCYAAIDDISKINDIINGNMSEYTQDVFWYPIAIVDDSKNIDKVIEKLNNLGYSVLKKIEINTFIVNNIKKIILIIVFADLIISLICMRIYTKKKINDVNKDIGIFKAIGYTNSDVFKIIFFENIILEFIGTVIGVIVYTILLVITKFLINNSNIMIYNLKLNYSIFGLSVIIILTIFTTYLCCVSLRNRIIKTNVINEINDL